MHSFGNQRRASRAVMAAFAVGALVTSSNASAFEAKHTPGGAPVHWGSGSIEVIVSPTLGDIAGADVAVMRALASWSGVGGAPEMRVRIGDGSERPGNDGRNIVYFAKDGYPEAGSALAITALSFEASTGAIVDADIIINGSYPFALLRDDATAAIGATSVSTEGGGYIGGGAFDILHVAAHETGHAFGLADEPRNPSALMYPFSMPGDATRRSPSADDLAGLSEIYEQSASPAASHGCGGATLAPGGATAAMKSRMPFALGALVLTIPLLRRRRQRAAR